MALIKALAGSQPYSSMESADSARKPVLH